MKLVTLVGVLTLEAQHVARTQQHYIDLSILVDPENYTSLDYSGQLVSVNKFFEIELTVTINTVDGLK